MLYFDIDYSVISEISTFLYVHRNKVDQLNRFIIKDFKNTLKLDISNSEHLCNIPLTMGYGTYYYNIDEQSKIEIKYFQKGEPVGTESLVKIYNGMIVGCETMELWEKFNNEIAEFIEQFNKKDKNKLNIFIISDKWGEWVKYSKIPSRQLSTIYTDEKVKQSLKQDIDKFITEEKEYDNFGIPYKRTYMLTGIPGSGKTSLIKALCCEFEKNLCILSINKDFDNSTMLSAFRNMKDNSFLLIEDIDCLFEKREHKDTPLITFSSFINLLDGVLYKHGLICFITTNHPEKLDPAILRSGRIDLLVKMDYPLKEDIKRLFHDLTHKNATEEQINIESNKFIEKIANKNITMSSIVSFLFKHRIDSNKYVNELISNNETIKEYGGDTKPNMYA